MWSFEPDKLSAMEEQNAEDNLQNVRRTGRTNAGVQPDRYGNLVPQRPIARQRKNQAVTLPTPVMSSTVVGGGVQMARVSITVPPNFKVDHLSNDELSVTSSRVSNKGKQELELKLMQLKLQIEENEIKMEQFKLYRESTDIQMKLLKDDLFDNNSQKLSSDEDGDDQSDVIGDHRNQQYRHVSFSTIKTDDEVNQHVFTTPVPRPRTPLIKEDKAEANPGMSDLFLNPKVKVNSYKSPEVQTDKVDVNQTTVESQPVNVDGNGMDALASAIVQAISSQNKATEKFVARQSQESKLPFFAGNPLDWPLFIHHYQQSTEDCGFTAAQNMARLQLAIKGEARKTVQALMIIPNNANAVVKRLQQRYGQSEYVIQSLVELAKKATSPKENKLASILDYANAISNLVTTVKALKTPAHLHNPQLIKELVDKLPDNLKLQWGEVAMMKGTVTLVDFADWMNVKATAASLVTVPRFTEFKKGKSNEEVFTTTEQSSKKCMACDSDSHYIGGCDGFKSKTVDERWGILKNKKLCMSCLRTGHGIKLCRRKKECGVNHCNRSHHPLLHSEAKPPPKSLSTKEEVSQPTDTVTDTVGHAANTTSRSVLLRVVPVKLYGPSGEMITNALLDEASTVTMISADLAEELELTGPLDTLRLKWTNDQGQVDSTSMKVQMSISSVYGGQKYVMKNVRTVKNLKLPAQPLKYDNLVKKWSHLDKVKLEDLNDDPPQLLIGQQHIHLTLPRQVIESTDDSPVLTRTRLGWVVHGPLGNSRTEEFAFSCFHDFDEDKLHDLVKESFKLESIGVQVTGSKPRSREDIVAEQKMDQVTQRLNDRWETGLLWRSDDITLPESKDVALRRLIGVERKLERANWEEEYAARINHYIERGYARKLTETEAAIPKKRIWYLPHFPTTHPNKPGKLRIVFDAASKSQGVSLNSFLFTGPDLLTSLPGVLIRFRQKKVAFTGDITEMFHQVKIKDEDCSAQRFLWRTNGNKPPDSYQLEVMMFGSVCSPYCAQYVKNRNAQEYTTEFPEAVSAIVDKHYMDDYLDSCDSVDEAIKLINQVKEIHRRGGFEIGKWISNSRELIQKLSAIPDDSIMKNIMQWSEVKTERVLGLHWEPETDTFTFRVNLTRAGDGVADGEKHPTKRDILRLVMLIFDPLGFLSHFTVKARILLQTLWNYKIGWDDEVPMTVYTKWRKWLSDLPKISEVKISRCYSYFASSSPDLQLHVFADASESAYCAVAYLRVETENDVDVTLVMSKARVAPLKPTTIPRLELQAALVASRIGKFILEQLEIKIHKVHYWTDSQTVLKWIRADAKRFQQFVSNRVGEIHEATEVSQWSWIPTKLNVADDATREGKADLSSGSRWWYGPDFLKLDYADYPFEAPVTDPDDSSELELKKEFVAVVIEVPTIPVADISRFSSYLRLVRATAYMLKFIEKLKASLQKAEVPWWLDMKKAESLLLRKSQWDSFPEEMNLLSNGLNVPKSSRLYQLSPCLDKNGVLCMQSRLEKTEVNTLMFPVILDNKSSLATLIIRHYHNLFKHQGQELVRNEVRQRYWIPHLRAAVRKSWSDCLVCKKKRAKPAAPFMGVLPECRVKPQARAFTIVGMDYFGPMEVTIGRRHEKRYGVLFTCMTTRAVHLELAHSLTTDSCIMAIRRMMNRRGHPSEMHSDNGTNLRGAEKELCKALEELDQDKMNAEMTSRGILWRFLAPTASHMAGSWERLIRSVNVSLATVLKSRAPREEVLLTALAEAEGIVNSRPLTDVPVDPDAVEALTPMPFLIGTSSMLQSPGVFTETDLDLPKKWRYSQQLANMFWRRWMREYLPTLQRRQKWHGQVPSLEVGDMVIVMDESLRRGTWPLGKITEVFPGQDGIVRVVEVRTAHGTYRRPVVKIAKLDIQQQ